MPQPNKSPSELYQLADSFGVIGEKKVRLKHSDSRDTWTADYLLPVDMETGNIQTARIVSSETLLLKPQRSKGAHLGRTLFTRNFWDGTVRLKLSNPRPYISPIPVSSLDPQTPAILPENCITRPGIVADAFGGFATYVEEIQEYSVALLRHRPIAGDLFLYEDEVVSPNNYQDKADASVSALSLLVAMRDHIIQNGTLTTERQIQ